MVETPTSKISAIRCLDSPASSIGRLNGEELAQYNLWLDYLNALELVDTSSAPDIEWPTPPAVQAR